MKQVMVAFFCVILFPIVAAAATVADVRHPWNGLVNITCKVSGNNGTDSCVMSWSRGCWCNLGGMNAGFSAQS